VKAGTVKAGNVKGGAVDALVLFRASRRLLTFAVREALQRKQSAMDGNHAAILNITLDCADARAQALFWAAALGWTAREQDDAPGHVEYLLEPPAEGFPRLYFTTVPEPKITKNRLHLDLLPPGDDPQRELARLLGLGATVLSDQPPRAGWLVLADPEGNEFCLEGAGTG
jgi:catechol 2,3-dioxygenase-like lactoylglutathione lyase family enzyme